MSSIKWNVEKVILCDSRKFEIGSDNITLLGYKKREGVWVQQGWKEKYRADSNTIYHHVIRRFFPIHLVDEVEFVSSEWIYKDPCGRRHS